MPVPLNVTRPPPLIFTLPEPVMLPDNVTGEALVTTTLVVPLFITMAMLLLPVTLAVAVPERVIDEPEVDELTSTVPWLAEVLPLKLLGSTSVPVPVFNKL